MHIFRKHIIQWSISLLLMAGLATHLVIPLSNQAQKTAFAQWLDLKVDDQGNESESTLRDHIRQLPSKTDSFDLLLQKASLLIAANENEFKLSIKNNAEDSTKLGKWLIEQWSIHQNQSGQQDAVVPESIHSFQKWLLQQQFSPKGISAPASFTQPLQIIVTEVPALILRLLHIPFLSGISINAP
ncbi:MAG: hypothetical protein WD599_03920 [Balneolaceae bacterium]